MHTSNFPALAALLAVGCSFLCGCSAEPNAAAPPAGTPAAAVQPSSVQQDQITSADLNQGMSAQQKAILLKRKNK